MAPFKELMEHFGGTALLEEVLHWGQALRVYRLSSLLVCSLCFLLAVEGVVSLLPMLSAALPPPKPR